MKSRVIFGLFLAAGFLAAQPATTTVADQFYRAVGGPTYCSGSFTLTWSTFYSRDGFLIQGGTSAPIPVSLTGTFSVDVVPTNTITTPPSGIYTVRYALQPTNCAPASEAWNVPAGGGPVNLVAVRTLPSPPPSLIPPASIAPPVSGPSTQAFCWSGGVVGWSSACGGGGSGGTVTNFSSGGLSPIFTTSVATATTTPALSFSLSNAGVGQALIGPTSGSPAPPTYRALVGPDLPDPGPTSLGGIQSMTSLSHRFINSISTLGVPGTAQPAFSDLTGSVTCGQLPALTGDATTSAGSCATSVVQVNGAAVPLSAGLTATNSSRQLVAATAANVVGLFSTCSGVQYLGADGSCHTAGTGTVISIATTSPIGGGTFTTSGTITCTTCVTAASTLDSARLVAGTGSRGLASSDLSGDVTTSGGLTTTVVQIEGGAIPISAAVVGTNAGSQLVAATAASIVSLFGSCTGTEYLGADGNCHSAGGTGTVTSVATTSPITGGTFSVSGTIACATCVVSAASLTNGQLVAGVGAQGVAVTDLTGDTTTSGGVATSTVKVHGVSYPATPSTNTVPVVTGSNTVTYEAVPNAALANSSLTVSAGTGISVSGCGPVSLGGTCTVSGGANSLIRTIGAGFDGSGTALTSGSTKTVYFTVPFACTIAAWNITVDAGTITFDVWKIATGTAIPTVSNSIVASAPPALSTGTAVHSTTLTSWTTSVAANDIFGININTVATATKASLTLQCGAS